MLLDLEVNCSLMHLRICKDNKIQILSSSVCFSSLLFQNSCDLSNVNIYLLLKEATSSVIRYVNKFKQIHKSLVSCFYLQLKCVVLSSVNAIYYINKIKFAGPDCGRVVIWNIEPIFNEEAENNKNVPKMLCQLDHHLGI